MNGLEKNSGVAVQKALKIKESKSSSYSYVIIQIMAYVCDVGKPVTCAKKTRFFFLKRKL